MGQHSRSATLFTKGAHLDRRGLGEFAVRKHLDRACGAPTERTFLCQRTARPELDKLPRDISKRFAMACMFVFIVEGSPCARLGPRHRRLQSEVFYERIETLVAVKQCQSLLNTACRDQCVDGVSDGEAK
jgi:hypothetical protein